MCLNRTRRLGCTVVAALAVLAVAWGAKADDAAVVGKLTDLGAQVTQAGGVVTRLSVLDGSNWGDAELQLVGQLTHLKSLTLSRSKGLNDSTIKHLAGLVNLEDFSTEGIQVSDAGLAGFAPLKNLRTLKFFHLSLDLKDFNGSGFAALKDLHKLESLTVAGTRFDDRGMAAVGQLKQLREFRTWHTFQTQAGNAHLAELPALKSLWLGQRLRHYDGTSNAASFDDATFDVLVKLTGLETLTLNEAQLSPGALLRLKELPKLKKVELRQIDVMAEAVEQLKAALPQATVNWTPLTDQDRSKLHAFLKP